MSRVRFDIEQLHWIGLRRPVVSASASVAAVILTGCGSLFAPAPPSPHFYTLDSSTVIAVTSPVTPASLPGSLAPDVLGAQTDGMIGYLLEQELSNRLPASRIVATLLTRVQVDPRDPAFQRPSKPIGPIYTEQQASEIEQARHWTVGRDGRSMRRLVASPQPKRVLGLESIRLLLEHGALVVAAGGGGIPVALDVDGHSLRGVDAVIDKDLCSGLLATQLDADCLVIATDVESVFLDWGLPQQRALKRVTPQSLASHVFAQGSMGPKVQAACDFVLATERRAVIGSLAHIDDLLAGTAGTQVCARLSDQ